MVSWSDAIVREVAERRVVIFIGSGVSKLAMPAMPTWAELLTELARRLPTGVEKRLVGSLVKRERYLDAAQIIRDRIDAAEFSATLRRRLELRPTPRSDIYRDLLIIDPKIFVTTNYDQFLEDNFRAISEGENSHRLSTLDGSHLINDLRSPDPIIIKMHGCITDPANVIFDRVSYYNIRGKNASLFRVVESLMTVNTVIFLGYSMSDPDIAFLLEEISRNHSVDHKHYAVVEKFEHASMRNALAKTYGVNFIEHSKGDFNEVSNLIGELAILVRDYRGAFGAP